MRFYKSKCNCEMRNRVWKAIGWTAVGAVALGVWVNFKSIRRYIKISMM